LNITVAEKTHGNYNDSTKSGTSQHNSSLDDKQPIPYDTIFSTATNELNKQNIIRLPTGSKNLDNILNGGIETGVITHIYGGPNIGKTQLCYTLCVMLPSQFTAIYIDTEGTFRPERIKDIAKSRGLDYGKILEKTLIARALDSNTQESHIDAACTEICLESNSNNIKLLIVDSIIGHYRTEFAGRSKLPERLQRLNKSLHLLLKTARSRNVAVVVTNHQMRSRLMDHLITGLSHLEAM
jgi:DNA repair protein RadA